MIRLFERYEIHQLARISGYGEETLRKLSKGQNPITSIFRRKMTAALEGRGFNADGMFDEVPEMEAAAT